MGGEGWVEFSCRADGKLIGFELREKGRGWIMICSRTLLKNLKSELIFVFQII